MWLISQVRSMADTSVAAAGSPCSNAGVKPGQAFDEKLMNTLMPGQEFITSLFLKALFKGEVGLSVINEFLEYVADLVSIPRLNSCLQAVDIVDDSLVLLIDYVKARVERFIPFQIGHIFIPLRLLQRSLVK